MADANEKKTETKTAAVPMPSLIKIEAGNGRDYSADRNRPNDENRNTTLATLHYRIGIVDFSLNVYGSFVKGRKAETLTAKLPPSVPKGVTLADDSGAFLSAATEHFVNWLRQNGANVTETAKRSGQTIAELMAGK